MPDHQKFDLLFALWRALAVGGTLRVVEPQRMGSPAGGDAFLALDELIELLAAIGFSVRPAQYLDRQGVIAGDRVIDADLGALRDGGSPITRAAWDGGRCMILDCVKTTETASNSGNFGRNKYFFIGDSHTRFAAGLDEQHANHFLAMDISRIKDYSWQIEAAHIGPSIAFSLNRYKTRSRTMEKVDHIFNEKIIPAGAMAVFSFGEIDLRAHVYRLVDAEVGVEEMVGRVAANYRDFLIDMKQRGHALGVWAAIAQCPDDRIIRRYPVFGTELERNQATRLFNARMKEICRDLGVSFFSVFDDLVDQDGKTRFEYYRNADPIHITQKARPLLWKAMPA